MSLYEYFVIMDDDDDLRKYVEGHRLMIQNRDGLFSRGNPVLRAQGEAIWSELGDKYPYWGDEANALALGRPWTGDGCWMDADDYQYGVVYTLTEEVGGELLRQAGDDKEAVAWLTTNAGKRFVKVNDNEW